MKGSFTGALNDKAGAFEEANGGTLFLDEIGDLSAELQAKLLRVLQGHEFERVGGLKTIHVDVRVVAATNRNLEEAMIARRFREDLFYRLNVLPIYIPPLRERKEEIPTLAEHFFKYYSKKSGKHFDAIPGAVMNYLIDYHWPGNIRELQNVMERAIVLGHEPKLHLSDFVFAPLAVSVPETSKSFSPSPSSLKDIEQQALMEALKNSGGNITQTAKALGIGRETIYRRLKKYNLGLKQDE